MDDFLGIVGAVVMILLILALGPFVAMMCLNHLGMDLEWSFKTWTALMGLILVFRGGK